MDLAKIEVLNLEPGDVLVVTSEEPMTERACARIAEHIKSIVPGHKVLVLGDGLRLSILASGAGANVARAVQRQ